MSQRSLTIDLTKGLLTVGMVLAHVVQFFGESSNSLLYAISLWTNLASFSGFLFCFGFAYWTAYLCKENIPWNNILKTALKCYGAFIISGVAFRTLVESQPITIHLIYKIAVIRDIPGYSEFLLSFTFLTLLSAIFQRFIRLATRGPRQLFIIFFICLIVATLKPSHSISPFLGQIVGAQGFSYFPVVQYLPLFLTGIYLSRHHKLISPKLTILAGFISATFIALNMMHIEANRFPPSAIWIVSSFGPVYLYYSLAHQIRARFSRVILGYLNAVGQNVLFYLVLSNLVIFTCSALNLKHGFGLFQCFSFFVTLMAMLYFIQFISIDLARSNRSLE
jgi:hypothetical protein